MKNFLTNNNMAFKIKPFFDLTDLSTSIFERDMGEDPVFARTNKSGVIIMNENTPYNPLEKAKTIAHEKVHVDQFKKGELDYELPGPGKKGFVKYKGKTFPYSVMQAGKGPWEKDAYNAEKNIK